MEEELQRLLRNDIIEEAHGPTEWLSSIVVVPKSNPQDVRICVDMRKPNQAIVRTRHITPFVRIENKDSIAFTPEFLLIT